MEFQAPAFSNSADLQEDTKEFLFLADYLPPKQGFGTISTIICILIIINQILLHNIEDVRSILKVQMI